MTQTKNLQEIIPFTTRIYATNVSQVDLDGIIEHIQDIKKNNPTVHVSNVGGYQSPAFSYGKNEIIDKFVMSHVHQAMQAVYNLYNIKTTPSLDNYWYNVNGKFDHNLIHDHPHSFFSAVLYLKTPENCGDLVFYRPDHMYKYFRQIKEPSELSWPSYFIKPEPGLLVIFPSYLEHLVKRNESDEERISIAFNYV